MRRGWSIRPRLLVSYAVNYINFFSKGPCGKPEDITHAKVEGSSYKFKDTLSYTCERGYVLVGSTSRTCREDGTWSKAPTCSSRSSSLEWRDVSTIYILSLNKASVQEISSF